MNPSSAGWIEKLFKLLSESEPLNTFAEERYYQRLRDSGFIYGTNVSLWVELPMENELTEEEFSKVNLLLSLFRMFQQQRKASYEEAVPIILDFYKQLNAERLSLFDKVLVGKNNIRKLEKVIHYRIQANSNIFTKNFSNIITNALLFIDVLAFGEFLNGHANISDYAASLEQSVTSVVVNALHSKDEKTDYDELLLKLLQSSLRYYEFPETQTFSELCVLLNAYELPWEKLYMLDLASMAVWNDETIDNQEEHFIWALGGDLKVEEKDIALAITSAVNFIETHKSKISFFNHSNPVKHFYDQSGKMVRMLMLRNKKRLTKELKESKELMQLLAKSTSKELTEAERKKMKQQLLDIFKTIPSLAIFVLPGGTVLLPLAIVLIPKLLPSAFDDNRVD